MQKVMIIGAGKRGSAILNLLLESGKFTVSWVIDSQITAEGIQLAEKLGIPTKMDWQGIDPSSVDVIIEATKNKVVFKEIVKVFSGKALIIPGSLAYLIAQLFNEKRALIHRLENEATKHELIFNTTNDGMIVIDRQGNIILFNGSAERMTGERRIEVLGKPIQTIIPDTRLPVVLQSKRREINQEHLLKNGMKIITTRIPLLDESNEAIGAIAVFKDITEVVDLAEQITDLKEIQTMLEAIIQSSDDAISVVDEQGRGMLINRAYTRLTGLTSEEVIGKPADADIYQGDSMHMQVLQTRRAVRGTNMKIGQKRKEVIVNVAPIIVDGQVKGSVGVIHDVSEIRQLNQELNRARQIIRTLEAKYTFEDIIGQSEEMQLPIEQAKLSARTPVTVLLRGESGTGKELFAHAIHNASERKFNKFVRVNCAAISESLLESELFGYDEGAFSGAKRGGKKGLFEEADNGSIFLDEIGELTPSLQAKLLRVLQESEIVRVGGTKPISINVRVIAATNSNLEKAIASGGFREDLYFRLNRMPIYIAPLRKRKVDIKELAMHLIQKINLEYGRNIEGITEGALSRLKHSEWPGNVRELENILGRAIIFMKQSEVIMDEKYIPDFLDSSDPINEDDFEIRKTSAPLVSKLERYECGLIKEALQKNKQNKTKTAEFLGISIRNLYYKMEKYNLEKTGMQ
ncbi:sigma-54-dependent Fis family transcriptional regulator [Peribacillus psychrosaccharolyticus]|uniref:Sigma-54-dependent Fis family transcriptional regulator n=1 Tax=Peribacillus psychrosaccharolyticus TaxID=1407 RepID=A0A974NLR1_PERPY|nr:sigma-54-dependent Fis family transcriptional regulator [Peribacillus psychrosaccharolyticus]MEC2056856.1 sigma-54-dependent Fis family transcriptional regulator [Peribacillus psychrosaccharolyticus]MED3746438.1 sigma-54-dependent Fis family transcriptional regulator [Peribacillus psychrosaccharolyticus]QQT00022.1 sigma-54-dependent Fis family transcriptional regulator [Peribacillus psychrosaccharolyticus]